MGSLKLAGQRVKIQAPGLPRCGSRRGRRSSKHSAGTSRLRAVVRAVTKSGGDAGDKAPSQPGHRAFLALGPLSASLIPSPEEQGGKFMCGIVAYTGRERCVEVLMEGLGHLEYRGYDSAGLALQSEGRIEQIREVGRLENLARAIARRNGNLSPLRTGVGHTRWATHGRPTEENAHPHLGGHGTVAVVHNGIIENFADLKEELQGRGFRFRSETDTEVMAHLLAERVEDGESLREALAGVLRRLEGSFAVAAVSAGGAGKGAD